MGLSSCGTRIPTTAIRYLAQRRVMFSRDELDLVGHIRSLTFQRIQQTVLGSAWPRAPHKRADSTV